MDDAVTVVQALGHCPSSPRRLPSAWYSFTSVDRALPFGLRSAPKIFISVADVVAWVLHSEGIAHQLYYLDDFLFLGAPDSDEAARALETVSKLSIY